MLLFPLGPTNSSIIYLLNSYLICSHHVSSCLYIYINIKRKYMSNMVGVRSMVFTVPGIANSGQ